MRVRFAVFAAASALLAGCANIMERTPGAPEWFDAKAEEIRGGGYPDLRDVPTVRPPLPSSQETPQRASTLKVQLTSIEESVSSDPIPTPDEIRARAAQLRAEADKTLRPAPPSTAPVASGSP